VTHQEADSLVRAVETFIIALMNANGVVSDPLVRLRQKANSPEVVEMFKARATLVSVLAGDAP
jgi:hypothetical protein